MVIGGNVVPITGGKNGIVESFQGSGLLFWPLEMMLQGKAHPETQLQDGASTLFENLWMGGREWEKGRQAGAETRENLNPDGCCPGVQTTPKMWLGTRNRGQEPVRNLNPPFHL